MGKVRSATAAEIRKADAIARRLRKHYADNWRVTIPQLQGAVRVNVIVEKRHALHAKVQTIDWFSVKYGVVAETQNLIREVDAILERIAKRPLFTIVAESDGKGNVTNYEQEAAL